VAPVVDPSERSAVLGMGAAAIEENRNRNTRNKCKKRDMEIFIKPPFWIDKLIIGRIHLYGNGMKGIWMCSNKKPLLSQR
jgi:hypothetical protein